MTTKTSTFSGRTWHYYDAVCNPGDMVPVSHYTVSADDLSPASPKNFGNIYCGKVTVAGFDEFPDAAYHNGIRKEMRVSGPVMTEDGRVLDNSPAFVRELSYGQQ
jgi:hypothetical protein